MVPVAELTLWTEVDRNTEPGLDASEVSEVARLMGLDVDSSCGPGEVARTS